MSYTEDLFDYSPSFAAEASHNLLHLSKSGSVEEGDFNFEDSDAASEYLQTLLPIPIILSVIGVLSILLLGIVSFFLWCCKSKSKIDKVTWESEESQGENENNEEGEVSISDSNKSKWYKISIGTTFIILLFAFITNFIFIYSFSQFTEGIDGLSDTIDYILDMFRTINDNVDDISDEIPNLLNNLNNLSASCPVFDSNSIVDEVNDFYGYLDDISDLSNNIFDEASDINDKVADTAKKNLNLVLWIVFSIILGVVLLSASTFALRITFLFRISLVFIAIIAIILFILNAFEMILTVSLSFIFYFFWFFILTFSFFFFR